MNDLSKAKAVAEAANELKEEFLNIVSHDLKFPISGILTFTSVLKKNLSDSVKIKVGVESIERFAGQMIVVIENLLDITRLEKNDYKLYPKKVNLYNVLHKILDRFKYFAKEKKIQIQLTRKEQNSHVFADETTVNQIFNNLVSNAVKFSEENTVVTINLENKEKIIVCSVTDQGPGN